MDPEYTKWCVKLDKVQTITYDLTHKFTVEGSAGLEKNLLSNGKLVLSHSVESGHLMKMHMWLQMTWCMYLKDKLKLRRIIWCRIQPVNTIGAYLLSLMGIVVFKQQDMRLKNCFIFTGINGKTVNAPILTNNNSSLPWCFAARTVKTPPLLILLATEYWLMRRKHSQEKMADLWFMWSPTKFQFFSKH